MYIPTAEMCISRAEIYISRAEINFSPYSILSLLPWESVSSPVGKGFYS